jgi:hypothetical protein
MNWAFYGLLVIFGAFIILLVFNPNLSCFGKRLRSPFYPLYRKKRMDQDAAAKAEDYGFHLTDAESPGSKKREGSESRPAREGRRPGGHETRAPSGQGKKKTDDYGFRLD